jgi:2-polyprenyl-6-methoxyphenol hydroxylase-like FAD-dependent oxidoreductase
MSADYDVAVIGAGPIGCAAAIGFAQRGDRVLLLEANPRAAARFAGEWVHPSGVRILEDLGLGSLKAASESGPGHGFVVHPDDGSGHIVLPYPDGMTAISFEHCNFVDELRAVAAGMPEIDTVAPARVFQLEPALSYLNTETDTRVQVSAARVVAADGRRSAVRRLIGIPDRSRGLSFMGGIAVQGVELPVEGYGHVFIGGPGPILAYRIASNVVRLALDVPAEAAHLRRDMKALHAAVAPVLPRQIADALATALLAGKPTWMETRFLPRTEYGRGNVSLVGDAAGCVHPLSAAGISLGLMDVQALTASSGLQHYARRRRAGARVSELLSSALYDVFSSDEADALALRKSIYDTWRASPRECQRTMRMLAGTEIQGASFSAAFTKIGLKAAGVAIGSHLRKGHWSLAGSAASAFLPWSTWSLAGVLPSYRKYPRRRASTEAVVER